MSLLLLDNSVIQRVNRSAVVAGALRIAAQERHQLCVAVPTLLEAGFIARSATDHAEVIERLTSGARVLAAGRPSESIAMDLQRALFEAAKGRAAGVIDLLIAGIAVEHDAVVLHYDSGFDVLASVDRRFRARWVVPRGSIP